ncbi:unnamed protein product [Ambrosiozyma monospora]|uniref:Unnamed protein product n=1 Tax=Ambrosiozyma monospora TaxID=43982 RepID=A0ACB5SWU1_AMBMO|nr:unnamed protein product [Ambrosiozyma monospora]
MDFVKKAIWGPDPKQQFRDCQAALRKNKRQLDREINDLNNLEKKTKTLIKQSAKKGDMKTARLYAKEFRNIEKHKERMYVSKATLDSIGMKLNEQQQMIKIKGSMQKSTVIMKQVNSIVKLPEMSRTVQELSRELMKAGVIDEMTDDIIDSAELEDDLDEDEQEQIDDILKTVIGDKQPGNKTSELDEMPETISSPVVEPEEEQPIVDDDDDEMLANMRQRLNALQ